MARNVALAGSLVIIGLVAFLTIRTAIVHGIDVLVVLSLVLLLVLGVGILGALTAPSDD